VKIKQLAERGFVFQRDHKLNQQKKAVFGDHGAAPRLDRTGLVIVRVVNDFLEQVDITTRRHRYPLGSDDEAVRTENRGNT
jgi:hypothetical protein